jgi:hypothetical protein
MPLRRSVALVAMLCLSFLMTSVCTAAVAVEYVPIQQYHSGMWADPAVHGEGFNVYVSPDPVRAISVLSFLDVRDGETTPSWFHSNETPQRPITYLSLNRVSGGASFNMDAVGLVESGGCDHLVLRLVMGLEDRTFDLRRLTPPAPGTSCYTCDVADPSARCQF